MTYRNSDHDLKLDIYELSYIEKEVIASYAEGNPMIEEIEQELETDENLGRIRDDLVDRDFLERTWKGASTEYKPASFLEP